MRLFAAIILLLVATIGAAAPVQVSGARLMELPDGTQLVFDISGPARHNSFLLDNPPRLVVDLGNARLSPLQQTLSLRSIDVLGVRTGIRAGTDLRIVVDLAALVRSEIYTVRSARDNSHRLVMDLYRHDAPAPDTIRVGTPQGQIQTVSNTSSPPQGIVIAIDPGHGGKDPGAIGPNGTLEKHVALEIARRLQALVNQEPGMRAVMTRNSDIYLHLRQRIDIARKHQAHMFVSIHADAFTNREARGSSVFILSTTGASSEAARWLARSENAADLIGGVSIRDRDETIASVLLDLSQEATLEASMNLAGQVLDQLRHVGNVHKRQVERAGFAVLKSPDIPSILVETAFISNPTEEARLRSPSHQQVLAEAIMEGIRAYFRQYPPQPFIMAATPLEQIPQQVHVIQRGESLAEIAQRYHISLSQLRAVNGLSSNQLRMPAGTPLTIPGTVADL